KVDAVSWKSKSKIMADGFEADMQDELQSSGSERLRWKLEITFMGMTKTGLLILDGTKGWMNHENRTEDMPKEANSLIRDDLHLLRLAQQLTPLRNDKMYTLSHLGETRIDNKAAVGLKITQKDRPDIDLFFDNQTNLPLRAECRVKEPTGMEVAHA